MTAGAERFTVSDEAIRSTEHCPRNFACLNGAESVCRVEQCRGRDLVICKAQNLCTYQERFGFADYLCTCPVRREIYLKYLI